MLVKKKSQKQERQVAREIYGKTVPASGAFPTFKGDVRSNFYLVECKTTEKDFYVLHYKVWQKIYNEALKDGLREPLMQVDLKDGKERYAVLSERTFGEYFDVTKLDKVDIRSKTFRIKKSVYINWLNLMPLIVVEWDTFINDIAPLYEQDLLGGN